MIYSKILREKKSHILYWFNDIFMFEKVIGGGIIGSLSFGYPMGNLSGCTYYVRISFLLIIGSATPINEFARIVKNTFVSFNNGKESYIRRKTNKRIRSQF